MVAGQKELVSDADVDELHARLRDQERADDAVERMRPRLARVLGHVQAVLAADVPGTVIGLLDTDMRDAGVAHRADARSPIEAADLLRRQRHDGDVVRARGRVERRHGERAEGEQERECRFHAEVVQRGRKSFHQARERELSSRIIARACDRLG